MRTLQKMKNRKLGFEALEAREMLSVNPLAADFHDDNETVYEAQAIVAAETQGLDVEIPQMLNAEVPRVMNADTATTLNGLTLNINSTNYAELNAQYDFNNITSIENSTITADGVTLNFSNCTTLSRTNLYARNGGVISFPVLTSATGKNENNGNSIYWDATGAGSKIDFGALVAIDSHYNSWDRFQINAKTGGVINLANVQNISYANLSSNGYGSLIDLSGLPNLAASGNMNLTTGSDGKIKVGMYLVKIENVAITNPADLNGFDFSKVTSITGSTFTLNETFDLSSITSLANSTITADGVTLNFSNCTTLSRTNLYARNGGVINFPVLTSATGKNENNGNSIYWDATGAGSKIDFSALVTIDSHYNSWDRFHIDAKTGGVINLANVQNISYANLSSNGYGSLIDLSGLPNLAASGEMYLTTSSDGKINVGTNLAKIENVTITNPTDFNGFDTSKVMSITNSTITADDVTLDFSSCTKLSRTNLYARNGGVINFPVLTSATGKNENNGNSIYWDATGAGSKIDFSALVTIDSHYNSWDRFQINAKTGGVINLVNVQNISYANLSSSDYGSLIDMSGLPNLAAAGYMYLTTNSNGKIKVGTNLVSIDNVTVSQFADLIDFNSNNITSINNSTITADSITLNFSSCTKLSRTNLYAKNGGVIQFSALTSATGKNENNGNSIYWDATGAGSKIDFSALVTIDSHYNSWDRFQINAKTGGVINLENVHAISYANLTSQGTDSIIDLSGFVSLVASGAMSITTNSEGQVKFGSNVKKLEQVTISAASLSDLVGFDPLKIEMGYESSVKINGAAIELPNSVTNISETIITGGLDVAADGVYTSNSNLILSGDAWLQSAEKGVFDIKADLLGDTVASGYFAVNGTIRFSNGSVQNPQKFEVMGQDKGATVTGFQNNFAIGRVELTNKTYVLLVDQNDNSTGTGKEALYVKTLVVGANCTLDLNGHNIYVYGSIINGTVVNGSITQLSDTGTILYDSPTPGKIGVAGETDQWTFYAQKGESLVATLAVGSGKSALLESPFLNYGEIKLYDPNGNLIKTVSGTSSGQNVTLQLDSLPLDGNYRIDVSAATTRPENVGNYVLTVTPMMLHDQTLPLNKNVTGTLANQYVTDRWVFSVETGQQIKFELLNRSTTDISFKLTDSTGTVVFDNRTTSSDTISITKSGKYTLAVSKTSDRNSSYAFRVDQTGAALLTLNTPTTGTATGNAYSNVYVVDITETKPLAILLNDYAAANNLRLYAKYGYAPSTTDYDFISTGTTEQSITIPQTHTGKLYIMVVGEYVPQPSTFTITAEHKNLIVNNVSTSQFGSNEPITITITGAGFDKTTTVTLVDSNNIRYNALTVSQENVTTLEVTFDPTIPNDTYKIEIKNDNSNAITLNDAVTVKENYGQSEFDAKLILPSQLGYHVASTLYIEYTNKGTSAITAPLLILTIKDQAGAEGAMLSLDEHFIGQALYASNTPQGYTNNIQIFASGATSGVLQAGETITVPIYWNGWGADWFHGPFEFSLNILSPDNTTPLNFTELKSSLKPSSIDDSAWDVIFTRLQSIMGTTEGDYVKMINNIVTASTGQSLYDSDLRNINELFTTALKWANDEFNPFGTLVSSIDAAVVGLNATLYFERSFIGTEIASRFVESDLGYGWDHNWNWKLAIKSDGDVILTGPHGAQRIFQVDGRREGTFLSSPGDNGSLRLYANGEYSLTEADGTELRFTSNGLLKSITDTNGNIVTATQSNGKLTKLADAYGNFITLTYNADGKIISVTDNLNNTTTYSYDTSGKNLVSATNQQNQTVAYNYASQTTGVLAHTLSSITFADGNVQTFTYDETGTLIKTEINDITPISYIGGKTSKTMLNYEVYEGDIIVQKLKLNKNGQITRAEDSQGRIVFYEYDYFGRVTKISDGSGKYSTIEYDKNGNITRSVNTNGEELRFTYSAKYNNLVTLIDSNGNKTTFRYDTRGNLVSMERADGTTSGITYNSDGSIAIVSNRRGDSYSYTYDTNGQLTETKLSTAEKPIRREYDSRGNLVKITDENDLVTTMEYDSNDWLTKITYPTGKSLEYTYDTFGRQTSIKSGTEYYIKYTYNSLGLLENVIDGLHGDTVITQYLYDNLGQLTKEIQGNGTYSEYIYDELGYTKSLVTYDSNDTVLSQFVYTYDTAGLVETSQTLDGQWTYSYDSTGQLTTADFVSTNVSISDQSYVYVYDSAGNRIETVTNGTTIEYVVNEMNQYTKVGDFEYKYDADGNMIQKKNTQNNEVWTFTWSQDDKLISTTGTDGTWEYEYDSFGNRIAVIFNGVRTEFLIDLNGLGNIIAEYDSNGNIITTYSHGYGLTSQIDNSGNTAYYGYDALGSTSIITDAAGSIVNHYVYDPFGQSLLKQEGINNPFQYVGEFGVVTDQHAELVAMRARWYDTNTGRFISEDPIGLNGGLNLYAYVENNTINFVDPSGELPIVPVIIGAGLVANLFNPNYANAPTSTSDSVYKWTTSDTASLAFDAITGAYLATALPATGIMTASAKILANKIKSYPVGGKMVKPVREWMQSTMGIGDFLKTKPITHFLKPIKQWIGEHPYSTYGLLFTGSRLLKGALKELVGAFDPNEMLGPESYGEEGYVKGDTTLPYRINFENDKTATAPAQRVDIVNQLDEKLDLSTFRLTQFGFGDITVTVPQDASMNRYEHTIEFTTETGKLIHVLFVSELDYETRTLYISFESLDPDTLLPPSIFDGFLPPENETGRGMGFVAYTIKHNADLVTGDSFKNIARIQFDLGEKIYTNQIDPHDPTKGTNPDLEAHITIDKDKPISSVETFSYSEAATQFAVNWGGTDVGSGIASYDIFVSIDDGAFEIWLPKTTDTSGLYFGTIGHTYSFYSVAYDNVGLAESKPATAEATVAVTYEAGTLQTPQNLRTQQSAKTTLALDWDTIADATQYELQRKINGGSFVTVYTGINSDFVDSELDANTKYTYRVRAFDASNSSIYGNEFVVTTLGGAASHHEQGFIVDIPMVTKIDVDLDSNKTTLTWSHLGDDYSYYVFRNGSLVSVAQSGTSYVDNNPSETVRYLLYAYHKPTGQWSKSLPIVQSRATIKSEIVSHSITPQGGITLNWNIPESQQFVIFRNGIPVSGNISGQSWTDTMPRNGDNQYTLYVNYKDEQSGRYVWTYSKTYVVQKPVNAQAAALPENFWSIYDLDLIDDVLIATI